MKVTVSFDTVRVVVPCGDGRMRVGDLIDRAVARYCKAVGKQAGDCSWITVHYLKSSDGGILDPDDNLVDVVDDKDQLNARYELTVDCAGPTSLNTEQRPHSGGDGNSACGSPSEGAGGGPSSPDVFRSPVGGFTAATFMKAAEQGGIVVPPHRRHIVDEQSILDMTSSPMAAKVGARLYHPVAAPRLPAVPSTYSNTTANGQDEDRVDEFDRAPTTAEARVTGIGRETVAKANADDDDDAEDGNIDNVTSAFFAFARDPARKSLTNNVAMLRWLDAQERLQDRYEDELEKDRKDPVGSSDEAETTSFRQPDDESATSGEHLS